MTRSAGASINETNEAACFVGKLGGGELKNDVFLLLGGIIFSSTIFLGKLTHCEFYLINSRSF